MGPDIYDVIARLRAGRQPFAVATVIRTADATSAKAGAKAAVTGEGEILGHLGGACVQRAVREAAAAAIADGATQVIRVKPADKVIALEEPDGARAYRSGCPSGGTVDLLIEPCLAPPRLVVFGESPIAEAVAAHGALAGFRVMRPGGIGGSAAIDPEDLTAAGVEPHDFVVIASQGKGDLAALKAALESPAERVSMVASRKKAAVLAERLVGQGVPAERIARLKSPAGLDLGGVDPHEIALSVLAEIVAWRNAVVASGCGVFHGETAV